jgi:sortase A
VSASEPEPQPEPEAEVIETEGADWPAPTGGQIQAASKPRHYQLPPGAVMGLTMKAIGIYNAPIFDSDEAWALDAGIRHVPETSMPWSGGAQRNVYLEGHRLGYPGTGSHLIFYNLDKLERGDEILLRDRDGRRYRYRVSDAFVVDPSDSWVMGQIRGRDMVTLQTCTGPGYLQRLIVRADRV